MARSNAPVDRSRSDSSRRAASMPSARSPPFAPLRIFFLSLRNAPIRPRVVSARSRALGRSFRFTGTRIPLEVPVELITGPITHMQLKNTLLAVTTAATLALGITTLSIANPPVTHQPQPQLRRQLQSQSLSPSQNPRQPRQSSSSILQPQRQRQLRSQLQSQSLSRSQNQRQPRQSSDREHGMISGNATLFQGRGVVVFG